MMVACVDCGLPYPDSGILYKCPSCGGLFDYTQPLTYEVSARARGVWRYADSFGFTASPISLVEGDTPLLPVRIFGRDLFFKCEYSNPTGSFKDRGMTTLVSMIKARGVVEAVEDSSGNAGASFAAYAARAGIRARVFVPESASGPKREQIGMYGAELVAIPGPRSKAAEAVLQAAEAGTVYASHAYLPFNLPGYATCAYEIVEQLGGAPGAVILPAGQGGLLLGLGRGFQAMQHAGLIQHIPQLVGVQASVCAPLFALWKDGTMHDMPEGDTVAEGVRVRTPLRAAAVVGMVRASGGHFKSVDEASILPGRDALARLGFYVEPTSALVWRTLEETLPELPDPVIAILTGSGFKSRV